MTTHELKTWPEPFEAIWIGDKHHEVRVDDRNYDVGDELLLREYDPDLKKYLGREIYVFVTHITRAPFLPAGLCVMSIQHIRENGTLCCHGRGKHRQEALERTLPTREQRLADLARERREQMRKALDLRLEGMSFQEIGEHVPTTLANQHGRLAAPRARSRAACVRLVLAALQAFISTDEERSEIAFKIGLKSDAEYYAARVKKREEQREKLQAFALRKTS